MRLRIELQDRTHHVCEPADEWKQQNHPQRPEEKKGNRKSEAIHRLPDRRQHPRHARANVRPKHETRCRPDPQHALAGEREQDAHRGSRGLDEACDHGGHDDAKDRVVHLCEERKEGLMRLHEPKRRRHQVHAVEDDAAPEGCHADLASLVHLCRLVHQVAERDEEHPQLRDLEHHEEADERRPNARPQQNAHAVVQRDQVRADELDEEDGDEAQAVGDAAGHEARGKAHDPVEREREEDLPKLLPKCGLEAVAQPLHAVEEERQATEEVAGHGEPVDLEVLGTRTVSPPERQVGLTPSNQFGCPGRERPPPRPRRRDRREAEGI
mmetsp:Transcript_19356/g.47503  ORF Transcript_19356/g.47503 Transcript_19356/m.47503 type:complete len:325 (+) Transcript_19356:381-1355(+)